MSETTEAARWADKLRIQIAKDLREISNLYLDLHAEAANHHDAKDTDVTIPLTEDGA